MDKHKYNKEKVMDLFKKCKSYQEFLNGVKESGLYPYFHQLTSGQDTRVVMEGKETIKLYDELIVNGSDLYDGKDVR